MATLSWGEVGGGDISVSIGFAPSEKGSAFKVTNWLCTEAGSHKNCFPVEKKKWLKIYQGCAIP